MHSWTSTAFLMGRPPVRLFQFRGRVNEHEPDDPTLVPVLPRAHLQSCDESVVCFPPRHERAGLSSSTWWDTTLSAAAAAFLLPRRFLVFPSHHQSYELLHFTHLSHDACHYS